MHMKSACIAFYFLFLSGPFSCRAPCKLAISIYSLEVEKEEREEGRGKGRGGEREGREGKGPSWTTSNM